MPLKLDALQLYRWIRTARSVDDLERELVARGEAFFQVSASGHEATAALAPFLEPQDYLHCHYRDKALLIARGVPIVEFFNSLLCNASSHSCGRQMSAHFSAPALNVLSIVGPVGNNALQAVGIAHQIKGRLPQPIVVCALGDGTTQQGEVLEAIAEAVRSQLSVLFLIEDNRYSISTKTEGKTFFCTPQGYAESFYGLPIDWIDGTQPGECWKAFEAVVRKLRSTSGPTLSVMRVERLTDHTNADDESVYRPREEMRHSQATADPVINLRQTIIADGAEERQIEELDRLIDGEVRAAAGAALQGIAPRASTLAKLPISATLIDRQSEYRGTEQGDRMPMGAALCRALHARMMVDPRVTLHGQDIEDPKGDVFGLTRGLSTTFPGRVVNAPLSESTIIGTSIGRALTGGRPVCFIQFADFLPIAFNQLASELGSLAWRTNGGWTAPVILMVSCGGYRPGLGPFHAGTYESTLAHIPGIDVAMPSTATDAAGILNAAFKTERPTVLLYPKALLNDPARSGSRDVARQFVPVGTARVVRGGADLTIVGWGNTVPLSERVAATLATAGIEAEVIDLRWISPWDREMVCESARRTRRLLVVHEDNMTSGFGAEIIAVAIEANNDIPMQCRRVTRPDTYVPCHFGNQLEVLPSYRSILSTATAMCDLVLSWEDPPPSGTERRVVNAIGSSPADQSVEVVEMSVKIGDTVTAGQAIACLEADKAAVEVAAPVDGTVEEIHMNLGDRGAVDTPLVTLRVARPSKGQPARATEGVPRLSRRAGKLPDVGRSPSSPASVMIAAVAAAQGRDRLSNTQLAERWPNFARTKEGGDGIFERTGIESRLVADSTQDAVSMAVEAAQKALAEVGIAAEELSLIVCSTSTPLMISPSTACQVLHRLAPAAEVAAYDVQAACSGYLYALTSAWDYLQSHANAKVMVLTTETMSRIVDQDDADTSFIFADAATATILTTATDRHGSLARLTRPLVSAHGEGGAVLRVPLPESGRYLYMDGRKAFSQAVRRMHGMLVEACALSGLRIDDLDMIVPHQANGRILGALCKRLNLPRERVWNEIRLRGNTSSSSIPLALTSVLQRSDTGNRIGLCVFGAGYTFGGAVLDRAGLDSK
jgi:2-oxoisovalerate dehydrogenase E1 component